MDYVLITGAGKGIGKEFAFNFASKGFNLVLVSLNGENLNRVKEEIFEKYKVDIKTLAVDLSKDDGPKSVYEFTKDNNLKIDLLINNAGFGDFGYFKDGDLNKFKRMIDLNDKALVSMCYLYIQDFIKNGYGHIVNISSIAGFLPGPYMAVYYASKAFVLNFSIALNDELKKDNIRVTTICPGPIDSNFWNVAGVKMSSFKKKYFTRSIETLVKNAIENIEKNKVLYVDGFYNKSAAFLSRFVSKKLLASLTGKVNKKLNNSKI